jgi:hypothetical protein
MLTPHLDSHLISQERLPFTAIYFGSIALTLYFAIGVSLFCVVATYLPLAGRMIQIC